MYHTEDPGQIVEKSIVTSKKELLVNFLNLRKPLRGAIIGKLQRRKATDPQVFTLGDLKSTQYPDWR